MPETNVEVVDTTHVPAPHLWPALERCNSVCKPVEEYARPYRGGKYAGKSPKKDAISKR